VLVCCQVHHAALPMVDYALSSRSELEEGFESHSDADDSFARPQCSRQKYAASLALALAGLAFLSWQRPGEVLSAKVPEAVQDWFVPNPGHRDNFGNFVADTWDHFQMPWCDSGSARRLDGDKSSGRRRKSHGPAGPTPEQQRCARHKAIAWAFHQKQIQEHWAFVAKKKAVTELRKWQGEHRCGEQIVNFDFLSSKGWKDDTGGDSGAHCQRACNNNKDCDGFSWNTWGCWLKRFNSSDMTEFPQSEKDGTYSGYRCDDEESDYPWLKKEVDKHTLPTPENFSDPAPGSMLCIQLILPYTYEVGLLSMQFKHHLSIFRCEHYAVYSSQLLDLGGGLHTRKINSSQLAEMGGQWGTALNTDAFMALWRAVILDGDYLKAGWLIKVDPDTVWFPSRLKSILHEQEQKNLTEGLGVYLNNCPAGLHGPLEILSQNAFREFALESEKCFWSENSWGNWQWGEDMWMDQCFMNTIHSHRVYVPQLLAEDHCNKWWGWESCTAKDRVAFHPFKDQWKYSTCVNNAMPTTSPPPTSTTTPATTPEAEKKAPSLPEVSQEEELQELSQQSTKEG